MSNRENRATDHRQNRQGAALIETLLGTILLLAVIVFSIGVCRGLNTRSRMLAADRTLAWLGSHLDFEPTSSSPLFGMNKVFDFFFPSGEKQKMARSALTSDDMARLIRHWHFRDTAQNEGIVHFDTFVVETGLFSASSPDDFKRNLVEQQEDVNELDEQDIDYSASKKGTPYETISAEDDGVSGAMEKVSGAMGQAMDMVMNFITGTFHRYNVSISYGMPMTFTDKAYEWLFDMNVTAVDESDRKQLQNKNVGGEYGFVRMGAPGCVMPALDVHAVKNSNPLVDSVKGIVDGLLQRMQDEQQNLEQNVDQEGEQQKLALYRPYDQNVSPASIEYNENPLSAIEEEELYALVAYEIHHLDDQNKHDAVDDVTDADKKYWEDKKTW